MMKSNRHLGTLCVSVCVLIALMVFMSKVLPEDAKRDLAGAEFFVS